MEVRGVGGCCLFYQLTFSQCENDITSSIEHNSRTCLQGSPSLPGSNGVNGHNGLPGRDGRDDAKGEKGVAGTPGSRGEREEMGSSGADTDHRNWKQCAWKNSDNRDIGLIKDCSFNKTKDGTAARVVYQGNVYVGGCAHCCTRWFITFNGAECSGPVPIDAALWIQNKDEDNHRPGFIEGYCSNIHEGKIGVGIDIGNCAGYGNSEGQTGWNFVSLLIIEEVPRSQ